MTIAVQLWIDRPDIRKMSSPERSNTYYIIIKQETSSSDHRVCAGDDKAHFFIGEVMNDLKNIHFFLPSIFDLMQSMPLTIQDPAKYRI